MYTKHFGLTAKPFSLTPNPDALFQSSHHSMGLTYLEYGLKEKMGFTLLTGEVGTGKTTLLRSILRTLDDEVEVAEIFNTNVSSGELIRLILQEFAVSSTGADKTGNLHLLNNFLIDQYAKGRRCLLVIDEAQNLSLEAMEEVRMLSNLSTETDILLQIILAGQPELKQVLSQPNMRQLAQRISVAYHLEALDAAESEGYIRHRLILAGDEQAELFDPSAVTMVHEHSRGIPRMINIICDAALVYAYADDKKRVEGDIVKQVLRDRQEQWPGEKNSCQVHPEHKGQDLLAVQVEELSARVEALEDKDRNREADDLDRTVKELKEQLDKERLKVDLLNYSYGYWRQRAYQLEAQLKLHSEQPGLDSVQAENGSEPKSSSPGVTPLFTGSKGL